MRYAICPSSLAGEDPRKKQLVLRRREAVSLLLTALSKQVLAAELAMAAVFTNLTIRVCLRVSEFKADLRAPIRQTPETHEACV